MGRHGVLDVQQALLQRRQALCGAVAGSVETLMGLDMNPLRSDTAPMQEGQSLVEIGLARAGSEELLAVRQALDKLKEGTSGVCEDCGCKIPRARLSALPHAIRCVRCQREWESR